jgi:hypothetical protein
VVELRVPELVEDPFREHFRELIVGSIVRAAEAQSERHRARGHRLRARRAERVVALLRPVQPVAAPAEPVVVSEPALEAAPRLVPVVEYEAWFGRRIRQAAGVVWLATLAALVANVVVLGVASPATGVADLGLIAMTFIWFFACIDDLLGYRRA